ncbi:MAG TPA: hypothetical protein VGB50_01230 [Flavobacterium sp.]|jgi:hypothetical protein
MKNLRYFLPAFAALFLAASCDSNDDGFYNTKYINAQNLATIETLPEYSVGDVLYVEAFIPNLLPEPEQSNPLNIRKTTGNADVFEFSYVLERNTGGDNWEFVDLTDLFIEDQGDGDAGSFIQAYPEYNSLMDAYIFRGGIQFAQTGNYRLSFGYNSNSTDRVEFISHSPGNNVTLNISSTSADIESGFYTFTVD